MRVLGIESSCDETAAAVVDERGVIHSDVVRSQVASHAPFGGVVPEIAARDHLRAIAPVVSQALRDASTTLDAIDAIAVTNRPGLVGALLVGLQAAKGLAWARGKTLVGVDHLVGHLLSVFLRRADTDGCGPEFPFVGLLVSGGHSALYWCEGPRAPQIRELGATRDDAVGEAFDKVAKLLRLGYPGGPIIDRLARGGDADRCPLQLSPPMAHKASLELSFSGIKSAVARHVAAVGIPKNHHDIEDLCASFQRAVTRSLVSKTLRAVRDTGGTRDVLAGGVAANRELRERMARACGRRSVALFVPPVASCTDNAAMIAYAGAVELAAGNTDPLSLAPFPRTKLPRVTRKGRGRR